MKNSRFLNHFFSSEMVLHENLTFFEPFLFYAKCRCEKNSRFLNHFDRFSARRLLSNEAFEKLLVFVTVQNLVARKTYVLGTIQLNHIIPLNLVARETYVLETIFRPRFEKLKVFLNRLRGAKCRRAKNSRFSNHLFCQIWCGTKNSRFLNRFFP